MKKVLLTLLCAGLAIAARADEVKPLAIEPIACTGIADARPMLIVLGGWKAKTAWTWHWLNALQTAAYPDVDFGLRCAGQGPQDASYIKEDIDTAALAVTLAKSSASAAPILLIAHSSGSLVAHRLLRELEAVAAPVLARIEYINLDGGVGEGVRRLEPALIARLKGTTAVYVHAPTQKTYSPNSADMQELSNLAPDKVRLVELAGDQAGCKLGAKWCLHEVVVNRRPYNPTRFDLERDYGRIDADHPVQIDYLPKNLYAPAAALKR